MRLYEVTNFDSLITKCKPYFNEIGGFDNWKNNILWHGSDRIIKEYTKIEINQERDPRNMDIDFHWQLIENMKDAGFKAHRGNSIFVSGAVVQAREYGINYVFVPIGEFNFSWSPKFRDLYSAQPVHEMINMNLADYNYDHFTDDYTFEMAEQDGVFDTVEIFNHIIYEDDLSPFFRKFYKNVDLKAAIKSNNEIMVNCEEGYLISEPFFEDNF